MLTVRWLRDGRADRIDVSALPDALSGAGFVWVDLESPTDAEEAILEDPLLGLDPLVVVDMRDDAHLPKLDALGDQLSLTVHGLRLETATVELETVELDVAVRGSLLVTFHEEPMAGIRTVHERLDRGALDVHRPLQLLHQLLDVMNEVFVPFVDLVEQRLDWIEEDIMSDPTEDTRREIYGLQRDVIQLRRAVVPQAEVIRRLSREAHPLVTEADRLLFGDVHDHLYRIAAMSDSYRQLLDSAMDSYRSSLDDDLNEMLSVLTMISALLLPVSVLASIYGMNFEYMPELGWRYSYFVLLGVFLAIVTGMLTWFRRRGWIGRTSRRERARRRAARVLEVPVLGHALKVPAYGARAVRSTGKELASLPGRVRRRRGQVG